MEVTLCNATRGGRRHETRRKMISSRVVTRDRTPERKDRGWNRIRCRPLAPRLVVLVLVLVLAISPTHRRETARSAVGISSWVCGCAICQDVFARRA
ncbi:hypothetical protein CABS03_06335 [Colletotrichum abscissum]|uniref:Uncharacterized protein n=1 Tax=Colletotrichum abscissum TaxID=1671311 RepID=A0A9Q0B1F9_9PEZI|nr:hypothetical protein CABS02_12383 [Colletotrichum abscissum]